MQSTHLNKHTTALQAVRVTVRILSKRGHLLRRVSRATRFADERPPKLLISLRADRPQADISALVWKRPGRVYLFVPEPEFVGQLAEARISVRKQEQVPLPEVVKFGEADCALQRRPVRCSMRLELRVSAAMRATLFHLAHHFQPTLSSCKSFSSSFVKNSSSGGALRAGHIASLCSRTMIGRFRWYAVETASEHLGQTQVLTDVSFYQNIVLVRFRADVAFSPRARVLIG